MRSTCVGTRRVEVRAPRRRDREEQRRRRERQQADDEDERPKRRGPRPNHGECDETDDADRESRGAAAPRSRLWVKPSIRISMSRAGPNGEIARQGRRVLEREDVEAGDRERVGDGLAGQRAAEDDPVADGPRREDARSATTAGNGDEPEPGSARHQARACLPAPARAEPGPRSGRARRLVARQRRQAEESTPRPRSRGSAGSRRVPRGLARRCGP